MAILLKIVKFKNNLLSHINTEKRMLVFSLGAVLIVNFQLLSTFFLADDFLFFYQISNWNPLEFIFSNMDGHLYIFRNLIFYCMFKLFGLNSIAYFSTVLLTHLGSAYILYKIIHLLTDKPSLAAAGTTIWGICPVNYATLAWYSAYGQILVGFFFLLFLYDLLGIEKEKILFSMNIAIRWSIYLFLMASSYSSGLAIACLSPLAIVITLWENDKKWKIAASILPVIAVILFLFIFKDSIYNYFSGEVQNTKPVALGVALSNYRIILKWFIGMGAYGIYCMAAFPMLFFSSTIKYPTAAIFISIPVVISFIILFLRSKEYIRKYYVVLSIFLLGLIGLTAYGRAPFYNMFNVPIGIVSLTLRYYYIVFIIVVIILSLMADELFKSFPKMAKAIVPFVFIVIALSIYPSIDLARRIDILNTPAKAKKIYYDTIADIEKTLRAYPEGSSVFIDNKVNDQIPLFFVSDTDFPGKAAIFSINYPSNTVEGRRVYFVENDCRVANKNNEKINWRISSLIVSKYYYEVKKFKDKKVAENAIIMVGNSITALGNWKKYFPAENIENFGIIGDDSYGVLNRLDIVIAKKPSKIFLLIGINDISGGCSNGQIIDNYKLILWKLRQELPNTEVYVQSVLPTNGKFIKNENIKRLNAEIKRITTLNKNTYIDMYVKFLGADGNIKPKYVTDGLHLNEAGYIVWVRELSSFL